MGILSKLNIFKSKEKETSKEYKEHLYASILAGGGGTRLWPRSREKTPKQFLRLFNKKTLTQITLNRINEILPWEKIFVVTVSEAYKKEILKEVPEMVAKNILVEPARRETGPAHGLGALFISKIDPQAVIITESVDRLVTPVNDYLNLLEAAAATAFDNKIMITVGVKPTYANVGYGHIKRGKKTAKVKGVEFFKIDKFVEKPPLELAEKYTASGDYYWNAGQFVWRADTLLGSLAKHAPDIYKQLTIIGAAIGTAKEEGTLKSAYEGMPKISIDYAVAEKDSNFLVAESTFNWTDIGDWNEVWKNLPKDKEGNVFIDGDEPGGEIINIDTSNALIQTDGRLIAAIDVDDIAIIDSHDALLICKRSQAQSVKKIVEKLKAGNRKELL
jgi:mannose-1-phosphate guanylyltransferase